MTADFSNPYYPYHKVDTGFVSLNGADLIPGKLIKYLLDLPDASGYKPVDDNSRPRVRLAKYLWYDEPNPLSKPLPAEKEKLSMLFTGENAELTTEEDKQKHPKGYRLYGQPYWLATSTQAKVLLKCYMGRVIPRSDFKSVLGIKFQLDINYALDSIMKTEQYSKSYAIFQCVVEALHGVNMTGIGTMYFNKTIHGDCGYTVYHQEGMSTYSDWTMAVEWQESEYPDNTVTEWKLY